METATFTVPRYSAAHKRTALRIVTSHPTHGRGSGDLPDALHAELVSGVWHRFPWTSTRHAPVPAELILAFTSPQQRTRSV